MLLRAQHELLSSPSAHSRPTKCKAISGFTLVELSIVLVILGLLVGGVLAGQSLIRASELRAVTRELQQYQTALGAFKDKYFAIPGDMPNATAYWGADANCPGDSTHPSTGIATCNGNGEGKVSTSLGNGTFEEFRFWQHLANAGLVEGTYSGVTADDGYPWTVAGSNSPKSKTGKGYWATIWGDNSAGAFAPDFKYIILGNFLLIGAPVAGSWPYQYVFSPPEAYNIDMKMDDGNPLQGKVMGTAINGCTGVANGSATSASYVLSTSTLACYLYFPNAY